MKDTAQTRRFTRKNDRLRVENAEQARRLYQRTGKGLNVLLIGWAIARKMWRPICRLRGSVHDVAPALMRGPLAWRRTAPRGPLSAAAWDYMCLSSFISKGTTSEDRMIADFPLLFSHQLA